MKKKFQKQNLEVTSNKPESQSTSPTLIAFYVIEIVTNVFFTIDYLVRSICSPNKKQFFVRPLNFLDIICILPFYVNIFISLSNINDYINNGLRVFQTIRIIRVAKHSTSLNAIGYTMMKGRRDLTFLIMLLISSSLILSSLLYISERNEPDSKYDSIPLAFYWGIITMTSVNFIYLLK